MLNRRELLRRLSAAGFGTAVFHRAVVALAGNSDALTLENLQQAKWISGVEMTDEDLEAIVEQVNRDGGGMDSLRKIELSENIPMAIHFTPFRCPHQQETLERKSLTIESSFASLPDADTDIAFLPVSRLSQLIQKQKITSLRLTNIYLQRLKKYAPMLRCVVTLTEELAIAQAQRADAEIKQGNYRGPLHGIPWGAKDLIAVAGYPTSWGIPYYKDRMIEQTATVAKRLEEAGAVLVAKLSLGALANGDQWFGGMTRCPWNPKVGSSGSSAGSAASVVAGLVGFALGSETLGSIVSPATRCGATALRPTFGRVSREGCMPLSWSLDKIGPICRSSEDCALVFNAIHGADGLDVTAGSYEFEWPSKKDIGSLKIGYSKNSRVNDEDREDLRILRKLGCEMVEIQLPSEIPLRPLTTIIDVEAASVFYELLRGGHTEGWNSWPQDFRAAQFISAVDYVRIQRSRTLLMKQFDDVIGGVDALINMDDLIHTNFTGHPTVVLPLEFRARDEAKFPRPLKLTGLLHDDERLLKIAQAIQSELETHLQQPNLDFWLEKFENGSLDEKAVESKQ